MVAGEDHRGVVPVAPDQRRDVPRVDLPDGPAHHHRRDPRVHLTSSFPFRVVPEAGAELRAFGPFAPWEGTPPPGTGSVRQAQPDPGSGGGDGSVTSSARLGKRARA